MKNTFKKLRREKNHIQNKLNIANKTVKLQIDEISRLNRALNINEIQIDNLTKALIEENKSKNRLKNKLDTNNELKNDVYRSYMKDLKRLNDNIFVYKIVVFLLFAMVVIESLAIINLS